MKNSKTPKIVVGVGLVAAYAGLAFYLLRDKADGNMAQNATTAQMADASFPPPAIPASSTDISNSVAGQPDAVTEAPVPVAPATANSVATSVPKAERAQAKAQGKDQAMASESPGASMSPDTAAKPAEVENLEVATSGNDSQITAEVRTQIAAVAPASTIDVTTTDGVVELSGSVPSEEEIDKVLLIAQNVAHVRSVDGSALMIGN